MRRKQPPRYPTDDPEMKAWIDEVREFARTGKVAGLSTPPGEGYIRFDPSAGATLGYSSLDYTRSYAVSEMLSFSGTTGTTLTTGVDFTVSAPGCGGAGVTLAAPDTLQLTAGTWGRVTNNSGA